MKKSALLIFTLCLILAGSAAQIKAQENVDQSIERTRTQIEELKKRKLAALEKQRKALEEEVAALENGENTESGKIAEKSEEKKSPAAQPVTQNNTGANKGASSDSTAATDTRNTVTTNGSAINIVTNGGVSPAAKDILKTDANAVPASGGVTKAVPAAVVNTGSPAAPQNGQTSAACLLKTDLGRERSAICDIAERLIQNRVLTGNAKAPLPLRRAADSMVTLVTTILGDTLLDENTRNFILEAEANRNDKQIGADSKASGTSSLVVKGGIPEFLGWAVENGAAEGSREGNTLTFRVNPIGLVSEFVSQNKIKSFTGLPVNLPANMFKSDDSFNRIAKNFSLGFSFDITRGTDPPVFTGSKQQLSAFSVRYQFLNERDPRHPRYGSMWEEFRNNDLVTFANQLKVIMNGVVNVPESTAPATFLDPDLQQWFIETNGLLAQTKLTPSDDSDQAAIQEAFTIIEAQVAKIPVAKLRASPGFIKLVNDFGNSFTAFSNARQKILDKIDKGQVISVEYTNYREVNAPDLSNLRFIVSKGLGGGADLTFNGSLTFFNKMPTMANGPATVKRIRDFDFAMQLDVPFNFFNNDINKPLVGPNEFSVSLVGTPILTFAGKYQRLQSDAVMPDGVVAAGTRGDLAFGQIKLTIPINFSGLSMKFPISASFANRTDLIKEKDVRGNFGFTFDIDPFLSKLRSSLFPR